MAIRGTYETYIKFFTPTEEPITWNGQDGQISATNAVVQPAIADMMATVNGRLLLGGWRGERGTAVGTMSGIPKGWNIHW